MVERDYVAVKARNSITSTALIQFVRIFSFSLFCFAFSGYEAANSI